MLGISDEESIAVPECLKKPKKELTADINYYKLTGNEITEEEYGLPIGDFIMLIEKRIESKRKSI